MSTTSNLSGMVSMTTERVRIIRLPSIPELVDEIIDLSIEHGRLEERLKTLRGNGN